MSRQSVAARAAKPLVPAGPGAEDRLLRGLQDAGLRAEAAPARKLRFPLRIERGVLYLALTAIVAVICLLKALTTHHFVDSPVWATYSVVVLIFVFGRFGLAWRYRPGFSAGAQTYLPSVAIIVPAYNEQDAIAATLRSCLTVDYPNHLIQVVVVDDCSTDGTLDRIRDVEAVYPDLLVVAADVNRGKRHVMAAGMQAARDADILVFIDSDSIIEPAAVRSLVRYFEDPEVGAVCGHTDVSNKSTNLLTRMQALQYYIAFSVYKSAEALFGSVTCCSGCFSGYRRSAIEPITAAWVGQKFLGQPSTYGDDRSLTNFLLPNWRILYAPDAKAQTAVPDRLGKFLRQQLRWKKSWLRESMRAVRIMWRKPPVMALFYYLGVLLPFVAPQVVFRALVVSPHFLLSPPVWYFGGVAAVALFYGLYYRLKTREPDWYKGIFFSLFYVTLLVAQLPYALLTIRDSKWGTR
ncbi:Glycosyl transferase [Arthrobacter sp. 9AX]|uniref:glycosyltransferase family 2 protein n=1 Tax=Arthrobacter sp. 9AX TaxID=2653131 RepID=UPI0012F0C82B|nr:glycosyltransferase [Arthrobacter sp. 9AX]VXB78441.1 Glycosyl transferase [Arthrobacter sp. 9AX]